MKLKRAYKFNVNFVYWKMLLQFKYKINGFSWLIARAGLLKKWDSMFAGLYWFSIVSYDSANKQKHHKAMHAVNQPLANLIGFH